MIAPQDIPVPFVLDLGSGELHPAAEPPATAGEACWIHGDRNEEGILDRLESLGIDEPEALAAFAAEETRPRYAHFASGDLLILRGVNLNPGARPEDMVSLRFWITPRRLVTLWRRRVFAVGDVATSACQAGKTPLAVSDVVAMLIQRIADRVREVARAMEDELNEIEEQVLDDAGSDCGENLGRLQRRAIWLRRYIGPQVEALSDICASEPDWLDLRGAVRLRELADAASRQLETLDALREHIVLVQDQLSARQNQRTQRTSYVLTVVAAVFLPLNLIASLFGANVAGVPGTTYGPAFWIMVVGMVVLAAIEFVVFRWLKWL